MTQCEPAHDCVNDSLGGPSDTCPKHLLGLFLLAAVYKFSSRLYCFSVQPLCSLCLCGDSAFNHKRHREHGGSQRNQPWAFSNIFVQCPQLPDFKLRAPAGVSHFHFRRPQFTLKTPAPGEVVDIKPCAGSLLLRRHQRKSLLHSLRRTNQS